MNKKASAVIIGMLLSILTFAEPFIAPGTNFTWQGTAGDGDWNNAANWDANGVPVDQDTGDTDLTGDMLIDFAGENPPSVNVPIFSGGSGTTKDTPMINLNKGTLAINIVGDGYYKSTSGSHKVVEVGNGTDAAKLELSSTTKNWIRLSRHAGGNLHVAHVKNGAELHIKEPQLQLAPNDTRDGQVWLDAGATLTVDGYIVVFGTGNSFIRVGAGASVTAAYGGDFVDLAAVNAALGVAFVGAGSTLSAVDHGATFTVSGAAAPAPSQVTNPMPANAAVEQAYNVDLAWDAATYAVSYDVYFGLAGNMALVTNVSSTSFDPGDLAFSSAYEWRVDAINASGTTQGPVWSFSTETVLPLPDLVTSPSPVDGATDVFYKATFAWDASADAESYDLWLAVSGTNLALEANVTTTSYSRQLAYDTTYEWRVDAKNVTGTTTGSVWTLTTEVAPPLPGVVAYVSPVDGSSGVAIDADLTWSAASDAEDYQVFFGPAGNLAPAGGGYATNLTRDVGTLNKETEYEWRVDSRNGSGTTTGVVARFTTEAAPVYTWNGAATDGNWSNAANWDAAGIPVDQSISDGLNGDMTIVFDGASAPTVNMPTLGGGTAETAATPKVEVKQGDVSVSLLPSGFFMKGQEDATLLQIGNGTDSAQLNILTANGGSPQFLARHPAATDFQVEVANHAVLTFDTRLALTRYDSRDCKVFIRSGGTLDCQGGIANQTNYWGTGDSYIALEPGSTNIMEASGVLNLVEEIEVYYGTWFRALGEGAGLYTELIDNNLVMTVTGGVIRTPWTDWTDTWSLSGADADMMANPDGDSLINLYEFGLGGNPTADVDAAIFPAYTLQSDGGSNWMECVYRRRTDYADANVDLDYYLEITHDLVTSSWTNDGYQAEVGEGQIVGEDFTMITNIVPVDIGQKYIRLIIE